MYRMRESKSKLELFSWLFIDLLSYFMDPRVQHICENNLKLSLRTPDWFNAEAARALSAFYRKTDKCNSKLNSKLYDYYTNRLLK